MSLLDRYHAAYSQFNTQLEAVNRYTKRGKDVPATLLVQFGQAWEVYQAAKTELDSVMAGSK